MATPTTKTPQKKTYGVKAVTPIGRISYPALFTPKPKYMKPDEFEYSVELLFAPGTNFTDFNNKVDAALTEAFGADKKKWPTNISRPLVDQQIMIEKLEEKGQDTSHLAPGAMYARFKTNATNGNKPVVCDAQGNDIIESSKVYGGGWGRVSCQLKVNIIKAKDLVTKKEVQNVYVTPYLQGLQWIKDGDAFGGGSKSAADMFEPVVDNDSIDDIA